MMEILKQQQWLIIAVVFFGIMAYIAWIRWQDRKWIEGRFDIVLLDLSTDRRERLTSGNGDSEDPRWSPDGRHIVFASNRGGSYDIYTMRADGSHVRRLTRGGDSYTPDWSP